MKNTLLYDRINISGIRRKKSYWKQVKPCEYLSSTPRVAESENSW